MRKTELGMLRVGDVFYYDDECYEAGHSDGRGYAYCSNVKTRALRCLHLTTVVEVEHEHID